MTEKFWPNTARQYPWLTLLILLGSASAGVVMFFFTDIGPIFLVACILLIGCVLYLALDYSFIRLKVGVDGIVVRSIFRKHVDFTWQDVVGVYVYEFSGLERIKVPVYTYKRWLVTSAEPKLDRAGNQVYRNHGQMPWSGGIAYVPKKKPTKWIFVDSGSGDNSESIYGYFTPRQQKSDSARFVFRQDIHEAIARHYTGEILYIQREFSI